MAGMATVVAFHAHPDDEVLLTGGTLARLAAEGHRTVVVVACCGGLAPQSRGVLADPETRLAELRASAARLGVARVVHLGYADSGHGPVLYPDPPGQVRFARADPDEAAAKLAALLREEGADLLLSYDPQGQYGHRDHVMVHRVGARAAALAGPVRVLEGTAPRETVALLFTPVRALGLVARHDLAAMRAGFTPRAAITHRIDVRRFAAQKQAALAAHRTPVYGRGRAARLFRLAVRLPVPVFGLVAGREWYAEPGARTSRPIGDVLQPAAPATGPARGTVRR
jgi:LmbE family N-acetylglucosaminyl deacetylase